MDDMQARSDLLQVKGIGPWTADIYLLMALRRPDVWPSGDLALASAVQLIKRLPYRPSPDQLDEIGQEWRPWRAVAARILWHYYLNGRSLTEGIMPSNANGVSLRNHARLNHRLAAGGILPQGTQQTQAHHNSQYIHHQHRPAKPQAQTGGIADDPDH